MKNKKLCSLFLAIILMFNMTAVVPFEVFAETGTHTYNYDSYTVEYAVLNEWEGNQSIQVTIQNTGTESILNWALAYHAGGEVNGLWNAVSPKENIIKNAGYNYEIAPGQSVSFGYTLSGENFVLPEKFEIVSKRADVTEGYEVQFDIYDDWGDGFQGAVTVTNTGSEPLEAWTLKFDTNFVIDNYWGGRIIENTENSYTIASEMWTNPIMPNSSSSFGFTAKKQADTEASANNFVLTSVRIDENTIAEEAKIIADAAYDPENKKINIAWNSTVPTGIFEVMTSLDGVNFETVATVENAASYEYAIDGGFGVIYIKVCQNIGSNIVESNIVTVTENAEDIDYELDTDEDGLPDYYEDILGTDKNNADTDDDGLSDGYEVLYLGTDPLKADSDNNGINDGDEDLDSDGLTNLQESNLGTDPNNADTDGDGLNDGAEVNTHETDPLKYDTDGDGISDGDEIALGLNPNSAATDGTPDGECTFTQVVSSDSEVLSAVNDDEETPFKVSLEMKSAGVAENNVYARESGYSNAIENSAIIGIAPEFVYTDGLAVEEVTVKFELDNSVINNTLGTYTDESDEFKGIKRLNVFMFFEDVNMLLPVETFHDEATNTVYTTTDRVGTYCLVDMEIFLDNLDKQLNDSTESEVDVEAVSEESEAVPENVLDNATFLSYNVNRVKLNSSKSAAFNKYKNNFDVTFLVDSRIKDHSEFAKIKRNILEMCDTIFNVSSGARVRFVQLLPVGAYGKNCYNAITVGSNNNYCTNYLAVSEALSKIEQYQGNVNLKTCSVKPGLDYAVKTSERVDYFFYVLKKEDSQFNPKNVKIENVSAGIPSDISVSVVSNYVETSNADNQQYAYIPQLCKNTKGIMTSYYEMYDDCLTRIYNDVPVIPNSYKAIIGTGYKTVVLDAPITSGYIDMRDDLKSNPSLTDTYKNSGVPDTDRDGLFDFQEIMFEYENENSVHKLIEWDDNGDVILPKFNELVETLGEELFYVKNGLSRYRSATGDYTAKVKSLNDVHILPIISDPTSADGDGDGVLDIKDFFPLIYSKPISDEDYNFIVTSAQNLDEIDVGFLSNKFFEINNISLINRIKILKSVKECYNNNTDLDIIVNELRNQNLFENGKELYYAKFLNADYELYKQGTSFEELIERSSMQQKEVISIFFAVLAIDVSKNFLEYDSYGNIKYKAMTEKEIRKMVSDTSKQYYGKIKNHPLRIEYENAVKNLSEYNISLQEQGLSKPEIARKMWEARRELGVKYKNVTPTLLREYIYDVNLERYHDPLGPSFEYLEMYKTYDEIISSSMTPNENVDKLLEKFEQWLLNKWGL